MHDNLTIAAQCFFNAFEPEKSDPTRARAVNELLHNKAIRMHNKRFETAELYFARHSDEPIILDEIHASTATANQST
jgi:hypothetical protein